MPSGSAPPPLEEGRGLDAAAHLAVEPAHEVVQEDELVLRLALGQYVSEPLVLLFAERPAPGARARLHLRVPERVERDEARVAPRPRVGGRALADDGLLGGVARVEVVGGRVQVESLPCALRPGGEVVALPLEEVAELAVVIAIDQEERDGVRRTPEVGALVEVPREDRGLVGRRLDSGRERRRVLLAHERVAEIEVEVAGVGEDVVEGAVVEIEVRVLVQVRVGLQRETERRTRRPLRVERAVGAGRERRVAGLAPTQAVDVGGIGREALELHGERVGGGPQRGRGLHRVRAGRGAELEERVDGLRRDDVDGDRRRGRPTKELAGEEEAGVLDARVSGRRPDGGASLTRIATPRRARRRRRPPRATGRGRRAAAAAGRRRRGFAAGRGGDTGSCERGDERGEDAVRAAVRGDRGRRAHHRLRIRRNPAQPSRRGSRERSGATAAERGTVVAGPTTSAGRVLARQVGVRGPSDQRRT